MQLFRKMSPNLLGDDSLEAVVHQRPDGVLARRADSEAGPGDEDRRTRVFGLVQHEVPVVAPFAEEPRTEPGAFDTLQPVRRDDLIGVHVGAVEWNGPTRDDAYRLHWMSCSLCPSPGCPGE